MKFFLSLFLFFFIISGAVKSEQKIVFVKCKRLLKKSRLVIVWYLYRFSKLQIDAERNPCKMAGEIHSDLSYTPDGQDDW